MATLKVNESHSWGKNQYSKLSLEWAERHSASHSGTVSVKNPKDAAAKSYPVPQTAITLTRSKDGKLTNNTDGTIDFTLS